MKKKKTMAKNEKWSYFSNLPTDGYRVIKKKNVLDTGLKILPLPENKLFKNRILSLWWKYYSLHVVTSCFHF